MSKRGGGGDDKAAALQVAKQAVIECRERYAGDELQQVQRDIQQTNADLKQLRGLYTQVTAERDTLAQQCQRKPSGPSRTAASIMKALINSSRSAPAGATELEYQQDRAETEKGYSPRITGSLSNLGAASIESEAERDDLREQLTGALETIERSR
jgi:hypothetical protein